MRLRHARRNRRGVSLVQAGLALPVFLTLVFGMIDLGLAVLSNHIVCEAARQGARIASVHGYLAPTFNTTMYAWGPYPSYNTAPARSYYSSATGTPPSYTVTANNTTDDFAKSVKPFLLILDPSTVTLKLEWLDNTNDLGNRVRVTVSAPYKHSFIIPLFGDTLHGNTVTLSANSTMTIAH